MDRLLDVNERKYAQNLVDLGHPGHSAMIQNGLAVDKKMWVRFYFTCPDLVYRKHKQENAWMSHLASWPETMLLCLSPGRRRWAQRRDPPVIQQTPEIQHHSSAHPSESDWS
jgi:hypothetical protein